MTIPPSVDELAFLATGRGHALFAPDVDHRRAEIEQCVQGKRVLVIGGAGSIGAATVRALVDFRPAALHVIDHSENNLAELVRDLRNRRDGLPVADFRALPLDFGAPIMRRFLWEQKPYDHVLNFAAVKHVRSEKDSCSLLQMLDTNVLKSARLLQWLAERGETRTYFCVSTDKAANPVNLMGASKRLMEHVIFSGEAAPRLQARVTSARFANVAFSDGSLLQSFLNRLQKHQPLAVPRATRRFFISLQEAGQICLLAATCAPHRHLLIPRLNPSEDLHDLEAIAVAFLRYCGYEPRAYEEEAASKANLQSDVASGHYPLLLAPLDTSGEKPYEEFVGDGEAVAEIGMGQLLAIPYLGAPPGALAAFLAELEQWLADPDLPIDKAAIAVRLAAVIPQFRHIETGKTLDHRM